VHEVKFADLTLKGELEVLAVVKAATKTTTTTTTTTITTTTSTTTMTVMRSSTAWPSSILDSYVTVHELAMG